MWLANLKHDADCVDPIYYLAVTRKSLLGGRRETYIERGVVRNGEGKNE